MTRVLGRTPLNLPSSYHPLHLCLRVALLPLLKVLGMIQRTLHTCPDVPSPQLTNPGASLLASQQACLRFSFHLHPGGSLQEQRAFFSPKKPQPRNSFSAFSPKAPSGPNRKSFSLLLLLKGPTLLTLGLLLCAWAFLSGRKGMGMRSTHMKRGREKETKRDRQTGWA